MEYTKIYVVIDKNNIVTGYAECLTDSHIPIKNGILVETDINLDIIHIVNNYKLQNNQLVELTENEKPNIELQPNNKIIVLESEIAELNKKNNELLDAVEFLLKNTGFIPQEV